MMTQSTLASGGFDAHNKTTRKAVFLARMDKLMPWAALVDLIEPYYPKAGNGRRPRSLASMVRMYCVANWFNLADEACEDALYDIAAFRDFCQVDLGREGVPDATTLLNFRHLLEKHQLGAAIFAKVGELLLANGLKLCGGTIVDATIIAAPSSTKNQDKARDPEMHQTFKAAQWYFGMKAHIGVDAESGLVHTATTTAANAHDITQAHALLHGQEEVVFADAGYRGAAKREEIRAQHPDVSWQIVMMPGQRKALDKSQPAGVLKEKLEKLKASVRAKVEHPFRVIKCQFGHRKTRYRGLAKNTSQLLVMFAMSNLWMVRKRILQRLQA